MKMLLLLLVVIHFSNLMAQSYNDYNPTVISNIGVDRFNQQLQQQQQQQQQQQRQQQPNEWIQSRTVAPPTIGQLDLQQQQQSNQFNMRRPPGFVNTPFNSFPPVYNQSGVFIDLKLTSYSNPELKLGDGFTCDCPPGAQCPFFEGMAKPLPQESRCHFSFTIVISAPDQSVQYIATKFIPLRVDGSVDINTASMEADSLWAASRRINLAAKPSAIDIFVHNLGPVVSQQGQMQHPEYLSHVDTFILPLNDVLPTPQGQTAPTNTMPLSGIMQRTTLTLTYSVQCRGNLVGANCDLACNSSSNSQSVAVCQSANTGYFSMCEYRALDKQVQNCRPCPWGISDDRTHCQTREGGILYPDTAGFVSAEFKTWTIVLGILFGLVLLMCIAAFIGCFFYSSRNPEPRNRDARRNDDPLLAKSTNDQSATDWNNQRRGNNRPIIDQRPPLKSSLRTARNLDDSQTSSQSSYNNNSSANNPKIPMIPSRSADV